MEHILIIDGQVFQTPAWDRGMGKYSIELISSLYSLFNEHDSDRIIILMSNKVESRTALKALKDKMPNVEIVFLSLLPNSLNNDNIPNINRKVIDDYISTFNSDYDIKFIIMSLLQGEIFPVFPSSQAIFKILVFYDVVPLMFYELYLESRITRKEYLSKLNELFKADKYWAISKTVANDLVLYLGVDKSKIISIDGGPINHSKKIKKYSISSPFVLMPTGNDLRKNNERGVLGFEQFNHANHDKYKLVMTSYFKDEQIIRLNSLSSNIIFTGNVSGEEINYLYNECSILLFPSEYEGLGLPILEAMERNKPIACSSIPVFREVSNSAMCFFDPFSVSGIAQALEKAKSLKVDKECYLGILNRYSWEKTGHQCYKELISYKPQTSLNIDKKNLAIFVPNPSESFLAGEYCERTYSDILPAANPVYFYSPKKLNKEVRINFLEYVSSHQEVKYSLNFHASSYDNVIYNIDNSIYSADVLFVALANPGIVILYELLDQIVWEELLRTGKIDKSRYEAEKKLSQAIKYNDGYLMASLVSRQEAIVVFSDEVKNYLTHIAEKIKSKVKIYKINLPYKSLAYDKVISDKSITLLSTNDKLFIESLSSDYQFKTILSKTKFLMINNAKDYFYLLEALKYGVVPVIPSNLSKKFAFCSEFGIYLKKDQKVIDELIYNDQDLYYQKNELVLKFAKEVLNNQRYGADLMSLLNQTKLRSGS